MKYTIDGLASNWRATKMKIEFHESAAKMAAADLASIDAEIKAITGRTMSYDEDMFKITREASEAGSLHSIGKTIPEIAELLGISRGQAGNRVRRWMKGKQ